MTVTPALVAARRAGSSESPKSGRTIRMLTPLDTIELMSVETCCGLPLADAYSIFGSILGHLAIWTLRTSSAVLRHVLLRPSSTPILIRLVPHTLEVSQSVGFQVAKVVAPGRTDGEAGACDVLDGAPQAATTPAAVATA